MTQKMLLLKYPVQSPFLVSNFSSSEHIIIQRSRLEAVYKALAAGLDERTFAQLEEEIERLIDTQRYEKRIEREIK